MRLKPLVVGAVFCAAAGLHAQQQISLLATIVDPATNAAVDKLDVSEVRVTEDGAAGKVLRVEPVNRTVKVHVLVDNGVGVGTDNIGDLRKGVRSLLEALPPDIETTVVTTAPQPRFLVRATKNRDELLKGVDRLAPDTGAGRFTESLGEAAQRAEKEKDAFTVLIAAGTTSGDSDLRERDIQQLFQRVQRLPVIVHVLLFSGGASRSASGGQMQTEVGLALTKMTSGRYENINSMSRYVTLMPELGAEVAKQSMGQTKQYRIVAERPEGKKGDLGRVSLGVSGKLVQNVQLEAQPAR